MHFDNSGQGPLQVPGFNGVLLDYQLPQEDRFAHGFVEFRHTPRLTARVVAMLRVMEAITEKHRWDEVVVQRDESRLPEWYENAQKTEGFLISPAAWDWCMAELRDKALGWRTSGRMLLLNTSTAVCLAEDVSLTSSLRRLIACLAPPKSQLSPESPDYLHLVDPSLFPLVYGQTRLLASGGHVPLNDLWVTHRTPCEEAPVPTDRIDLVREWMQNPRPWPRPPSRGYTGAMKSCWSNRFQWLPCEVKFSSDGTKGVRITSNINNLHPQHHRHLYALLEVLIAQATPTWDNVLFKGTYGRSSPRILTYGFEAYSGEYHKVWKAGRHTGRAIISQARGHFPDPEHHKSVSINLAEEFHEDGLQVIIQVSRIDLKPDNPTYAGESMFHVEGLLNEHIAATTVYCVDEENVTEARFTFQHKDKIHAYEYDYSNRHVMASILDLPDWDILGEDPPPRAVHNLGSVPARRGRLLSWPNTLRSKADSFTLQDPRRAGHRTLIKLWLVDPHYRICSTHNVPPQQHDWWAVAARTAAGLDARLPAELVQLILDYTESSPMSRADALHLREEFHREQVRAQQAVHDVEGHHIMGDLADMQDQWRVGESP